MRYMLENTLLFDDAAGMLTGVSSEKSAKLPYAAVLLLKVFCENPRVLLSRDDLMDRAWTEHGLRASGNNLYNTLSLIRKTVETLDVDLQIIRTQPKVGLILEVDVVKLDEPGHQPASPTAAVTIREPEVSATLQDPVQQPDLKPGNVLRPLLTSKFYFIWTLFIVALIIATQGIKAQLSDEDKNSRQIYYKLGELQQCTLFRFNEPADIYPDESMVKKISLLSEKYDIDCKNRKVDFYIYSTYDTHNTYNSTIRLDVICVLNKKNNVAMNCFNKFHQKRKL